MLCIYNGFHRFQYSARLTSISMQTHVWEIKFVHAQCYVQISDLTVVTGQFADKPRCSQSSCRLVNSPMFDGKFGVYVCDFQ